jgi:hypothetical protein
MMMKELIERLRGITDVENVFQLCDKAADAIEALQAENERLTKQLPEGMEHCTIQFKECEKGHGWLTADNWVQHECGICERDALQKELTVLREFAGGQCTLPKVIAALGPMSLWSKDGLDRELAKARAAGATPAERDALKQDAERYRWLTKNMTFYNTDEASGPVLASVSKRIWYHATDSLDYPLDAAIDASIKDSK